MRYLFIFLSTLFMTLPFVGSQQGTYLLMAEDSNPFTRQYLPYPFPKTREEVIADFKCSLAKKYWYYRNRSQSDSWENLKPLIMEILTNNSSTYTLGKILKIRSWNSGNLQKNYTWLILIMDKDEKIAARCSLRATGDFEAISDHRFCTWKVESGLAHGGKIRRFYTEEDLLCRLEDSLGKSGVREKIKSMERVSVIPRKLGNNIVPMWEITLSDDTIFFFSVLTDKVFRIDRKISWNSATGKEYFSAYEEAIQLIPPNADYIKDNKGKEFLILTEIPRKCKSELNTVEGDK